MLKKVKKIGVELVDWALYKALSTKQKQRLSSILTVKQKNMLKSIIKPGKKRTQLKKVERLKYRLYNLGFYDRALADLKELFLHDEDAYTRRLAGWELALWHANKYTQEDARECLTYIDAVISDSKDEVLLRRAAILRAECYDLLGEQKKGMEMVEAAIAHKPHPDLYLSAANLEESMEKRMTWINKALSSYNVLPVELSGKNVDPYDQLDVVVPGENTTIENEPKVTIIIPAYNAEDIIHTAIDSMLMQTWRNIEIIVADDYSSDNTGAVIAEYTKKDSRVRYVRTGKNGGAYVARNHALQLATGDYITINDADDWSHPEKIETQVKHLENNPKIIANFSQQARATEDLKFYRRGKPGQYIFTNMSSLMFRKEPVFEKVGFWDCVRFAGDSEFLKRVKIIFGEKSVVELPTAPLSFQRQSANSLTAHSAFGFPGYFMGVRKEYAEAHDVFHRHNPDKLRYEFPQERRFAIPEPMWPTKEEKHDGKRHFDVIIASEFRLLGGTNMSNLEEIKAHKRFGKKTGLVQMSRYDLNSVEEVNLKIREMLDGEDVQLIVYGEKVTCDVLIVRHPPILEEWQRYLPEIEAKQVAVIVNQPPKRDYSEEGLTLYNIPRCVEHLQQYVGQKGIWYPIGPLVREALEQHHGEELEHITLSKEDWVNIIDLEEWRRPARPEKGAKIKIGRHSRNQYVKWPHRKEELLKVYPNSDQYEVRVLGGASVPKKMLGELPSNWRVLEFGEVHPKEFLAQLDVFVYYTHPDWVEAFGRVIFEAMAVGVPVVIPPSYEKLFGDAAVYAKTDEVTAKVEELMSNDNIYNAQVEKAFAYVEENFGYSKHAKRLEELLHGQS